MDAPLQPFPGTVVVSPEARVLDQMRELEHFAEIGRLSACLLHEISSPLTAAMLYLEQSDNRESPHIKQARRNMILLQRYVEAARQQVRNESTVGSFYVRPQLDQVRRVLTPLAKQRGVRLRIHPATQHKLIGDPVKFQQIIANLIINAIDAYDTASHSEKIVTVSVTSSRQWLLVRVADKGSGISSDQLPRLFEPFYTTKATCGRGLGLGLAMVKRYVEEDFCGSVSLTSSKRKGTEFITKLRITPRYSRFARS